jgi:hypothetical protein
MYFYRRSCYVKYYYLVLNRDKGFFSMVSGYYPKALVCV